MRINVQITANAGRNEVVGWQGDRLKIKVKAPAVEGKANEELIRFLAERLTLHRREVRIARGETAKSKIIEIDGLPEAEVLVRLDAPKAN